MTHRHIPTLPPHDRLALARMGEGITPTPRHRRSLPPYIDLTVADVTNQARCVAFGWSSCSATFCPRHQPETYASHMARHATDSI